MTNKYEREKPRVTKLIEQGYGYVIVRRLDSIGEVTDDPNELPDPYEYDEGYIRADIEKCEGGHMAVWELDGERHLTPIGNRSVRVSKPYGMGEFI